jgi:hypothetical protein
MRHGAFLCGVMLILASSAGAQVNPGSSLLVGSPMPSFAFAAPSPMPGVNAFALSATPDPPPEPEPQGVYGVLQNYNWLVYGGFTHVVFYELPGVTGNLNGFSGALDYYFHGGHFGADGEFTAVFAPQNGANTTLEFALGGARYRIDAGRGIELWVHGMVGVSHFVPLTPFGGTNAFAWQAGGGADFNPRHRRLGYRVEGDSVGTRFFGTHQYNVKVSLGIVYKF